MDQNKSSEGTIHPCSNALDGEILEFTPRNFHQSLAVRFPPQRLPVCARCKKNYRTRDSCRIKGKHTNLPWTTAYVCITLDASCTGPDGKYIVGRPLISKTVQSSPYYVTKQFMPTGTVCCVNCKKANRTQKYCREVHKHRGLPWTTVHVVLSASEGITVQHDESRDEKDTDGDDINEIAPSRTFLCMISANQNSIRWLEQGAVNGKVSGPQEKGTILSLKNVAATTIQQQAAAAWQSYNQYYLSQMMLMQNQKHAPNIANTQIQKKDQKRKKTSKIPLKGNKLEGRKENMKEEVKAAIANANFQLNIPHMVKPEYQRSKHVKEEVKAAIANANFQAHAAFNEQCMRQQFLNAQMFMQPMNMMQMKMIQQMQQAQAQQHHGKCVNQSRPPRKRRRKKDNLKGGSANVSGTMDEGVGNEDDANETAKLPLVEGLGRLVAEL